MERVDDDSTAADIEAAVETRHVRAQAGVFAHAADGDVPTSGTPASRVRAGGR